ncbi:MAG: GtrA family protein [Alistipes sp.]|jgi:putative flippase GtrA|nr:GtrA family protein [Alistipes sp.]
MPLSNSITKLVDFFYLKPFRRIPKQTFRYIACGGMNFAITTLCYHVSFYYIFAEANVDIWFMVLSPYIASLGISMPVNFLTGFWLQSRVSFKRSPLKRRVQLFRYFATAVVALLITTLLTKVFSHIMPSFPTLASAIIYCITAIFSFVSQKYFTFRGAEKE